MPEESKELVRKPHQFQPGREKHPLSGRKKGSVSKFTWVAREMAEAYGTHPMSLLMQVATTGTLPPIGGPGAKDERGKLLPQRPVAIEEQAKCLRDLMGYLMPKISALAITGADGGPLQLISDESMAKLMDDPESARQAQQLALRLSTFQRTSRDEDVIEGECEDLPANNSPTVGQ